EDLETIKRQNEVERLDREWMLRRDEMMTRDKRGRTSEPSAIGSVIGAVVAVGFGIFWMAMAQESHAPAIVPLIGVVVIIPGIVGGLVGISNAARYQDEQRSYEQQRETLLRHDRNQD